MCMWYGYILRLFERELHSRPVTGRSCARLTWRDTRDTPDILGSRPVWADLRHKMVALGLVLDLPDMVGDMSSFGHI